MFNCNYLNKLKDKTFHKLMISDQKHKCEKAPKFGTNGLADTGVDNGKFERGVGRIETEFGNRNDRTSPEHVKLVSKLRMP